jgi:hypothetical protein
MWICFTDELKGPVSTVKLVNYSWAVWANPDVAIPDGIFIIWNIAHGID